MAGALGLPDSARPGALRPQEQRPVLPKSPPAEVMEIPPVIDRPFEVDQGPKVVVQKFRLIGTTDLGRFGIHQDEPCRR